MRLNQAAFLTLELFLMTIAAALVSISEWLEHAPDFIRILLAVMSMAAVKIALANLKGRYIGVENSKEN